MGVNGPQWPPPVPLLLPPLIINGEIAFEAKRVERIDVLRLTKKEGRRICVSIAQRRCDSPSMAESA